VNGSFKISDLGNINHFDPVAANQSGDLFSVPDGAGNSVNANNVAISDTPRPEFATVIDPKSCDNTAASIDLTSAGQVTYHVQFGGGCGTRWFGLVITLTSAAFSGCNLTLVSSSFPGQGQDPSQITDPPSYNNTVTGSLQESTLSLTAEYLTYFFPIFPNDKTSLNATWRLEGCPSVSHKIALMTAEALPLCAAGG
jgi:hypothetical protein